MSGGIITAVMAVYPPHRWQSQICASCDDIQNGRFGKSRRDERVIDSICKTMQGGHFDLWMEKRGAAAIFRKLESPAKRKEEGAAERKKKKREFSWRCRQGHKCARCHDESTDDTDKIRIKGRSKHYDHGVKKRHG